MSADLEVIDGGDPIRRQAAAWFARLRADDVSQADTRQWQAWLEQDPRHRSAYERLERLWSSLGQHATHAEIGQRLAAADAGEAAPRRTHRRGWLIGMAASLAALAFGGWMATRPAVEGDPLEYATAVGEQRSVMPEDGTRVTLDTDSRLQVRYSDRERLIVLERGRAYFKVAKDASRPLRVKTDHGSVRAIGTEFEVYRHAHDLEVALVEGKVLLLPEDGRSPGFEPVEMQAGQRARIEDALRSPRVQAAGQLSAPTWLSGQLVFEDTRLDEAIAEFSRYSHVRVTLEDDDLSDILVTGVFRSDGVKDFVGALADAYPIRVETSASGTLHLRDAERPML